MYFITSLFFRVSCIFFLLIFRCEAFWIISHHPLISQRLDPIINGNNISAHTHTFVGDAAILGDDQNSTCTTSEVKDDRSRYWSPQLYYYSSSNNTFSSIPLSFVNTYYLNRGGPSMGSTPSLKAFPNGFRMIAGSAMNFDSPLNDSTAASAISFVCLNYTKGSSSPQTNTMPIGPCYDGIRTQIVFPSCWNGVDLDSPNHQSHVSYPIGGFPDNGDCPSTHPVKFMTLFYEFIWSTGSIQSDDSGTLILANGDTKGYSFHADFISGWNTTTLQAAIDQCTGSLFGNLQGCQPFQASYQQEKQPSPYCTAQPIIKETVLGSNLNSLPGCNPIRNGPFQGKGNQSSSCAQISTSTTVSIQQISSTASASFSTTTVSKNVDASSKHGGSKKGKEHSHSRHKHRKQRHGEKDKSR